jgi:hypothetical protein
MLDGHPAPSGYALFRICLEAVLAHVEPHHDANEPEKHSDNSAYEARNVERHRYR